MVGWLNRVLDGCVAMGSKVCLNSSLEQQV